jgi:hypothetical protein
LLVLDLRLNPEPDFLGGSVTNAWLGQQLVPGIAQRDRQQILAALTERSPTSRGMATTKKRLDRATAELRHFPTHEVMRDHFISTPEVRKFCELLDQ